jgi:hypothetical protein
MVGAVCPPRVRPDERTKNYPVTSESVAGLDGRVHAPRVKDCRQARRDGPSPRKWVAAQSLALTPRRVLDQWSLFCPLVTSGGMSQFFCMTTVVE